MNSQKIWRITQAQIAELDVDSAILHVDPEQIPDQEIFGLHGAVRLRIEGARGMADVVTNPAARSFVRALHARWPWAGYFLRLAPIKVSTPTSRLVDTSIFIALALAHVDNLTLAETPQGIGLRYDADQFCRHLADLQVRAAQLAEAVDIPPSAICQRETLITQAVASFFAAGKAFNPPPH
jgi:hypothetical protein